LLKSADEKLQSNEFPFEDLLNTESCSLWPEIMIANELSALMKVSEGTAGNSGVFFGGISMRSSFDYVEIPPNSNGVSGWWPNGTR
jgi:hypothetical protein